MNVIQPEKVRIGKKQLVIYISIILICIISILVVFYLQFYSRKSVIELLGIRSEQKTMKSEDEIARLKLEFNNFFNNTVLNETSEGNNSKEDESKELVYTKYQKKETKINGYDIDVKIPYINVDSEVVKKYNEEIKNTFATKARDVLKNAKANTIYTVEYAANVHEGILSIIIQSNLKEGSSAQRVIVETYCYDLRNKKELSLEDVIDIEKINKADLQQQIQTTIETEQRRVEALKENGYNIYSRDISSDIYKIENSKQFYLNKDALYIIYAYGNDTFTSERDLVII